MEKWEHFVQMGGGGQVIENGGNIGVSRQVGMARSEMMGVSKCEEMANKEKVRLGIRGHYDSLCLLH